MSQRAELSMSTDGRWSLSGLRFVATSEARARLLMEDYLEEETPWSASTRLICLDSPSVIDGTVFFDIEASDGRSSRITGAGSIRVRMIVHRVLADVQTRPGVRSPNSIVMAPLGMFKVRIRGMHSAPFHGPPPGFSRPSRSDPIVI
jgi:hypothetical protein